MFSVPWTVSVRTRLHVDEFLLFRHFYSQYLYLLFQRNQLLKLFVDCVNLHAMARLLVAKSTGTKTIGEEILLFCHKIYCVGGLPDRMLALRT